MLTGKLWLDYDKGEEEEHWDANVTRGIFRDDEIVLEFSGHDPDVGKFYGTCKLTKSGALYIGGGSFTVRQESAAASVSVALTHEKDTILLTGIWRDAGDADHYDVTVELERS